MGVLSQLLSVYSSDALLIAIVFLVSLSIFVFLFAKEKSGGLLLGLLGYIGWIFSSPFIYVQETINQIAATRRDQSNSDPTNEQYLISRLLLILRGVVVAVALIILAATVATGWGDFLPSKWLRAQESQISKQISAAKEQQDKLHTKIQTFDDEWANHKNELVNQHQTKRAQDASAAVAANSTIESSMAKQPSTAQSLNVVRAYLDRHKQDSFAEVNDARRGARILIQELSLAGSSDLNSFVDNWRVSLFNTLPETLSDEQLRAILQPELVSDQTQLRILGNRLPALEKNLQEVVQAEKYHPDDLLLDLVKGAFSFIFFVWTLGLLLEALLLGVFVARDVHFIRLEKLPSDSKDA
jgi:hypothetical protein